MSGMNFQTRSRKQEKLEEVKVAQRVLEVMLPGPFSMCRGA